LKEERSISFAQLPVIAPEQEDLEFGIGESRQHSPTEWLPITALRPADSPRLDGEDLEHSRMLARVEANLPPILVHRSTMRVIDGMHRLSAAMIRGDKMIQVRFFDGSDHEAFVLAVKSNVTHGRPLSLADRTKAAERIVTTLPNWSDRAIAEAAGLGTRSVADIRRRLEEIYGPAHRPTSRIGRDGRVRPVDYAEGRLKASQIIKDRPDTPLRDVARSAGVSPATALDVRKRIVRGEDPVPSLRRSNRRRDSPRPHQHKGEDHPSDADLTTMLQGLANDPSLRFTESGRNLLRWLLTRAIRPGEWNTVSGEMPAHCTYIMANVARIFADQWLQVANDLEASGPQRRDLSAESAG
jgi:ParB-like chromosome segregation protein Spo0J